VERHDEERGGKKGERRGQKRGGGERLKPIPPALLSVEPRMGSKLLVQKHR